MHNTLEIEYIYIWYSYIPMHMLQKRISCDVQTHDSKLFVEDVNNRCHALHIISPWKLEKVIEKTTIISLRIA